MSLPPPRARPPPVPHTGARGMRVLATAMLAGMAAIFIAATGLEAQHPAWGFVRAFAEAGLVGGIADWFAVTALFRHPLGLPIPHTAIVPAQQGPDRRRARLLPARTISSPPRWSRGGCAISTSPARSAASSRSRRGEGRLRAGRLAAARRHPGIARPGAARRHGQDRARPAHARRRDRAPARPDARGGDDRASGTCRWSMRSSPGPAARSTPTRI